MVARHPSDRALVASIAANTLYAGLTPEQRRRHTEPARTARFRRYLDQTDPSLPEAERIAAAERLRTADMKRLALKSAAARRARSRERAA